MATEPSNSIYDQTVKVTQVYLGPAADRFIARQIENHLEKQPKSLSAKDLLSLIDWLKLSISMLTENSEIVEEYVAELRKLAEKNSKPKKAKKL